VVNPRNGAEVNAVSQGTLYTAHVQVGELGRTRRGGVGRFDSNHTAEEHGDENQPLEG
jgi:hypothetical protein